MPHIWFNPCKCSWLMDVMTFFVREGEGRDGKGKEGKVREWKGYVLLSEMGNFV